ncbi:hypothetical protein [Piscinibacter koreensis]|uniref:hypothetical protein n=1 Tax=Piscinibacter koreensis TaxID=2742824 RepID=UPI001C37971E|nr:hypothetical protein [Schlegelella koreensis]
MSFIAYCAATAQQVALMTMVSSVPNWSGRRATWLSRNGRVRLASTGDLGETHAEANFVPPARGRLHGSGASFAPLGRAQRSSSIGCSRNRSAQVHQEVHDPEIVSRSLRAPRVGGAFHPAGALRANVSGRR